MQLSSEQRQADLIRIKSGDSVSNYPAIFSGFISKGIPEAEIKPRINIFTFNSWVTQGRRVKKGEHGVKCHTWIVSKSINKTTGEATTGKYPKKTTVFHISQTNAI